jgi:hypothetical protein
MTRSLCLNKTATGLRRWVLGLRLSCHRVRMGGVLRGWPVGAGTLAFGSESAPADPGGFGPVGAEAQSPYQPITSMVASGAGHLPLLDE